MTNLIQETESADVQVTVSLSDMKVAHPGGPRQYLIGLASTALMLGVAAAIIGVNAHLRRESSDTATIKMPDTARNATCLVKDIPIRSDGQRFPLCVKADAANSGIHRNFSLVSTDSR
jgi:hypothetical protein